MRGILMAALGAVLASLVLEPAPMLAQKVKPVSPPYETQLEAVFRNDPGDNIYSDGGGLRAPRHREQSFHGIVITDSSAS